VLDPLDGDVVTQDRTKERQLTSAQLRAKARCLRDGTVVLHEPECSIALAPPLGHVPFLAPEPGKGGRALLERPTRTGHPRAIDLHLLPGPLLGQTLEALLTEGALDRLEHPHGELRMAVRKLVKGLGCEPPQAGGAADLPPFVREVDEHLALQDGEMLANSHRRDAEPLGHPCRGLGAPGLEGEQNPFPGGNGGVGTHADSVHGYVQLLKFEKYIIDKYSTKEV
jgi:hypothetical protein